VAAKNLTKEQAANLLRLEAGSYLKVWIRNNKCEWSSQYAPSDDNTENCMWQMQAQE
jgi:NAD(P)H-flavin reductase